MRPAGDVEDPDAGLAGERTDLAWTRTAIAFAAVGAAMLKSRPVAGVPVLAFTIVLWEVGRLPRRPARGHARPLWLLVIAATVTAIAAAALCISLIGHAAGLIIKNP
jgi:uncharacterized membrane protein YidH (DUF202 family)